MIEWWVIMQQPAGHHWTMVMLAWVLIAMLATVVSLLTLAAMGLIVAVCYYCRYVVLPAIKGMMHGICIGRRDR